MVFKKSLKNIKGKHYLLIILLSIIGILLLNLDAFWVLTLKSIMNNIASGRSDFKIISFLIYIAICSAALFIYSNDYFSIHKFVNNINQKSKLIKILFISLIIIGFILNLASFITFTQQYDLDINEYYISVENGRESSTQLTHIHTLKSALSKAVDYINPKLHRTYDAGEFYANHLPQIYWQLTAAIIIILMLFSLIILLLLKKQLLDHKYQALFTILFLMSSFSCLKNILDGGIFSTETVIYLPILLIILNSKIYQQKNITHLLSKVVIYSLLSASIFSITVFLLNTPKSNYLINSLSILVFTLLIIAVYYFSKTKDWISLSCSIIAFIIWILIISSNASHSYYDFTFDLYPELFKEIPENTTFTFITEDPLICQTIIYSQEDLAICQTNTTTKTDFRKLSNKNKLYDPTYRSIQIDGINCDTDREFINSGKFILIEGKVPSQINNSLISVNFTKQDILQMNKYPVYQFNISAIGCIPNYELTSSKILEANGLKSFIYIN